MNTAELLVKCLENEGVKVVFGIPGEENLAVMNALARSNIRFITVRHEQGAAFMADVYGRLTGRAGVCLATLGPGATNLITGVADANSDGAPLVAITGQVSTDKIHLTAHQFLDLTKMFEPVTKRTKLVMRPDSIAETHGWHQIRRGRGQTRRNAHRSARGRIPAGCAGGRSPAPPCRPEPGNRVAGTHRNCGGHDLPQSKPGDSRWQRRRFARTQAKP